MRLARASDRKDLTMNCIHCGAELRPGAHFCNACGADQTQPAEAAAGDDAGSEDKGATRLKRPARVPRPAPGATMEDARDESDGDEAEQPREAQSATGAADTPDAPEGARTEALTTVPAWENVVTAEYMAVARPVSLPPASTPEMPAAWMPLPQWNLGGISWPLPLQIIKGGRYRIEQVIQSSGDPATGENVYRVRDLQGYERCWSCGAEFGPEHSSESFCDACGADLYGRPLRMFERLVAEDDGAESAEGDEPSAGESNRSAESENALDAEGDATSDVHRFVESGRSYRVVPEATLQSPFPMGARLLVGASADVGKTRAGEQNEDSIGVLTLTIGVDSRMAPVALLVVADGMGGHSSGQEASRLVVRTLTDYVLRHLALPFLAGDVAGDDADDALKGLLFEGARTANAALCQANADQGVDSGCTLVAALVVGETAYLVNVGDSRAYALVGEELLRVTVDHSLVEQLIAGGIISPEERYTHPQRNKIYKSLGDDSALQPDTFVQKLQPGTRLLLCCDGVWEMVRDDELTNLLTEAPDPQQAAEALVARANENGGEDNISVIVLEARA
jgi:serine/threonine protein phosphatase PrpC/predicted RNA-binding Zn-ribbon protein involved in translation (DUF1610 family)